MVSEDDKKAIAAKLTPDALEGFLEQFEAKAIPNLGKGSEVHNPAFDAAFLGGRPACAPQ